MKKIAVAFGSILLTTVIALLSGGCSASEPNIPDNDNSQSNQKTPLFSGPFADEYKEAWDKTTSEDIRQIIADEVISDQEWATVKESLKACLAEHGIDLTKYDDRNGSYEAKIGKKDGDVANQELGDCETSSGEIWLARLYRAQTGNPSNVPDTELLTECLVRNGAVPKDYTEEDYLRDAPDFSFPYVDSDGSAIFTDCNSDFSYNK